MHKLFKTLKHTFKTLVYTIGVLFVLFAAIGSMYGLMYASYQLAGSTGAALAGVSVIFKFTFVMLYLNPDMIGDSQPEGDQ